MGTALQLPLATNPGQAVPRYRDQFYFAYSVNLSAILGWDAELGSEYQQTAPCTDLDRSCTFDLST